MKDIVSDGSLNGITHSIAKRCPPSSLAFSVDPAKSRDVGRTATGLGEANEPQLRARILLPHCHGTVAVGASHC